MEFFGYAAAIIIGLLLGLTGGGGSILTVPVLVYLFSIEPVLATGYSLFIVGATSLVGAAKAYKFHLVDFRAVSLFGIPSIFAIFIARHFVLPIIPEHIFFLAGNSISRGSFLMMVFAVLMLAASLVMIRTPTSKEEQSVEVHHYKSLSLLVPGLLVGFITGLLGAGGGFLIIPALVLILKLPMKKAIGTSLNIIAINSIFGFLFSIKLFSFNWSILITLSLLAITGVIAGIWLSKKINNQVLKKIFGWFVLAMGIYIFTHEFLLLIN